MDVVAARRRKPRLPALSLVHAPPATEASALAVLGRGACVYEVARSPYLSVSAGGVPRSLAPLAAASLAPAVRASSPRFSDEHAHTRTNMHTTQGKHTETTHPHKHARAHARTQDKAIAHTRAHTHARTCTHGPPLCSQRWTCSHGTGCAWSATTSIHRGCSTARSCTVQSGYGPTGAHFH